MKTRKKIVLIILFLTFTQSFSQLKDFNGELFSFKVKKEYKQEKSNTNNKNIFKNTFKINEIEYTKTVTVSKSRMNLKKENIKTISDLGNLEKISFVDDEYIKENTIQGITGLYKKKLYYIHTLKLVYTDNNYNNIKNAEMLYEAYYIYKNALYVISYKITADNMKNIKPSDLNKVFYTKTDLEDLNVIIKTLKINT